MILPTKHLPQETSLLAIGAEILRLLDEPKTVSRVWADIVGSRKAKGLNLITYDWFILALDLLFMMNSVGFVSGRLYREG